MRGARGLGGFAGSAAIAGAASVLTIPFVTSAVGAYSWSAMATGQAVGGIGSLVVALGWGVTGPAEIAAERDARARRRTYRESLVVRAVVAVPIVLICAVVAGLTVPATYAAETIVSAIGAALTGMSAAWYFVGTRDPRGLMLAETLPRAVILIASAALLQMVPQPVLFAAAGVLSALVAPLLASRRVLGSHPGDEPSARLDLRTVAATARRQGAAVTTSLVAGSYKYAPLIVLAIIAPAATPAYALADRLFKFANAAMRPVAQVLQGWVPAAPDGELGRRIWTAVRIAIGFGVMAGLAFAVLAPLVSELFGAGALAIPLALSVPMGLTMLFSTVSQTTGLACLVALDRVRVVAVSAVLGAVTCLALLWPAITAFQALGAAWSVTAAELAVLSLQCVVLLRVVRRRPRPTAG